MLWVQQGKSFGRPDLPDSALATLSDGLESEVGTVSGADVAGNCLKSLNNVSATSHSLEAPATW